ncbi:MAG: hypothetical protein L0J17_13185 [Brevibacterium sp.]|nr:hypothetical protein [Brevibacterium sp.]MDN5834592.1 hypothetical protein [Brevibacterium sp.]MDN6158638.1 hypothetical protein [Brevibacterium sp.]MDN6176332.1 hypothetical protein [Brevibacterium sp.]MDN6189643.1 hypothetical protein [Brevibacterium sp.]
MHVAQNGCGIDLRRLVDGGKRKLKSRCCQLLNLRAGCTLSPQQNARHRAAHTITCAQLSCCESVDPSHGPGGIVDVSMHFSRKTHLPRSDLRQQSGTISPRLALNFPTAEHVRIDW